MSSARLLIVEDDLDIANMLRIYFTGLGYDVDTAQRGSDALDKTLHNLPNLIILDIMLPDIDGFEVCRLLRTRMRTSHIPIIFLTQKDERSDKLQGLELGADDYITKPFDIEELKLRVQRAISRSEQQSLTDPRSGLPSGRLIEEQLRRIIRHKDWVFMDIRINHYEPFKEVYGFLAADDVLRFTTMLLSELVDKYGNGSDFIGHAGGDNFVLITGEKSADNIRKALIARFSQEVVSLYNFMDREQGYVLSRGPGGLPVKNPLMSLAIGVVSPLDYEFADIREITEVAAEARRRNS
jgi:PleD family two-component response regulator